MNRRQALICLLVIVCLGIGLRSYYLTARSLWFDEAFSWRLIQFSWGEMITRATADVHPALYYILLKSWAVVFGSSLLSMRLFSVMAAGGSIAAMYLITSSAWTLSKSKEAISRGRAMGLTAALFLAVSGWQIAFAWEARMYTVGVFFTLLSTWLLIKAIRQKRQLPWWYIGYAIAAAAMIHTHYYALFSLFAQVVFIIGFLLAQSRGRVGEIAQSKVLWYSALSAIIIATLFAPWLPTFLQQRSQVEAQFWIPALSGWSVPDTFYRMIAPTIGAPTHHGIWVIASVFPLLAAIIALIWLVWGYRADGGKSALKKTESSLDVSTLTALMAVIPFIVSILLSLQGQSLYQDRYFVFAQPFLIITTSVIIFRFRSSFIRRFLICALTLILVVAFGKYWTELKIKDKPGAHGAAQYVFATRTENEPVYSSSPFVFFAIAHYAQEEFKNSAPVQLYSETGEVVHFAGGPILKNTDIVGPQLFTNSTIQSFWMVDTTGFGGTELKIPTTFRQTDHKVFPEIYGYQGDVIANRYRKY